MAEWKFIGARRYECSACGEGIAEMPCDWASGEPLYNFCPYCGVNIRKMWVETDEPQTDKHKCRRCLYYDISSDYYPCSECVDYSNYSGEVDDEPQTERNER